ncbi:major facilitator superfamily MFS_1 [Paenibacillus curdlanolyticus YK9]|uniref:Major facilitator superfamily MFS_1 n=1 Tax=Paenibacillus curdlanolyticus YK9 TaxID=717606 RepID=E0I632_9BACL|nr:MFS transporter [Paenibacillus curdlanolyticus]EFM12424.1 major facilitator superfamily MFS_1 [Paenibacillus curdlanolyticus YK9]
MPHQESATRLWTLSFLALTFSSFLLFLNLQMLLSSFPAYVKSEFGASDFGVSLVTSVFAASAIGTRFVTAALMRKLPRSTILFLGIALAALTTALYAAADSIGSLLVMRIGYGVGFGMASTIIPTLVSQIIPADRIGEGIGYFGLSSSLAMSIGPAIGMNVMKHAGFGMLVAVGTATLLFMVPLLLMTRAIPPQPKFLATSRMPINDRKQATRRFPTKLLMPALLNALLSITYSGLLSFIALFGQSVHLEQVGLFFLFNVVTILIVRPISGKLFDSRGPAIVLIPAAISVMASLTVLAHTTSMLMLILSALLYGLGFGAIQPTLQAWMIRVMPEEKHAEANSMFYNSTDFGVAIGALLLGVVSSVTSYGMMYQIAAGFMAVFLILFLIYLRYNGVMQFTNDVEAKPD